MTMTTHQDAHVAVLEAIRRGCFDAQASAALDAAIAAMKQAGEPVAWELRVAGKYPDGSEGSWHGCSREDYERAKLTRGYEARELYAAPTEASR